MSGARFFSRFLDWFASLFDRDFDRDAYMTPAGVSIAGPATTANTPAGPTTDIHPYEPDVEGYCVECGEERTHPNHRRNFVTVQTYGDKS